MQITSTAFQDEEVIPKEHSKDGENVNPPLTFSEVPTAAASLALIIEDPDAPEGIFTHWILYDMSPATLQILKGKVPETAKVGLNDFGEASYDGPQPPSGRHRYIFKLFALDKRLDELENPNREKLYEAMKGAVLAEAEIMGLYGSA